MLMSIHVCQLVDNGGSGFSPTQCQRAGSAHQIDTIDSHLMLAHFAQMHRYDSQAMAVATVSYAYEEAALMMILYRYQFHLGDKTLSPNLIPS